MPMLQVVLRSLELWPECSIGGQVAGGVVGQHGEEARDFRPPSPRKEAKGKTQGASQDQRSNGAESRPQS